VTGARDIDFAADDGLHPFFASRFVKAYGSEEVSVIRDGGCRHLQLNHTIHDGAHLTGTIQEAVVGVKVEMNEFSLVHSGCQKKDEGLTKKGERFKAKGKVAKKQGIKGSRIFLRHPYRCLNEFASPFSILEISVASSLRLAALPASMNFSQEATNPPQYLLGPRLTLAATDRAIPNLWRADLLDKPSTPS